MHSLLSAMRPLLTNENGVPYLPPDDLADRRLRQLVNENDLGRQLELGQPGAAVIDDRIRRNRVLADDDHKRHLLAEVVGPSHHHRLHDAGDLLAGLLDLRGRAALPSSYDDLLRAAD